MKWKHVESVVDKKAVRHILVLLSVLEEQIICEFRRVTKLPLDDVYISLKGKIKKLTQSNLYSLLKTLMNLIGCHHACLSAGTTPTTHEKKTFTDYKLGYVHIDITQVKLLEQGKYYIFVGIERV